MKAPVGVVKVFAVVAVVVVNVVGKTQMPVVLLAMKFMMVKLIIAA